MWFEVTQPRLTYLCGTRCKRMDERGVILSQGPGWRDELNDQLTSFDTYFGDFLQRLQDRF